MRISDWSSDVCSSDLAKTASHEYRPPMSDLVVHSTPEFDPGYNVRTTLLRAAFGPEKPPPDIHLRLITWSRAAATNTLKAVATDLKIVEAFQASRYRPTLPLKPPDLYMLIEDRARAGMAKIGRAHD